MSSITFHTNLSKEKDVLKHLKACDEHFVPALSSKVNLVEYSNKLAAKADRFEAWDEKLLVGLVAIYFNEDKKGFITNVSLIKDYQGTGIATRLINICIEAAIKMNIESIGLEVNLNNSLALNLYSKLGFVKEGLNTSDNIYLNKSL